jgi:hypothetical protein
MTKTLKFDLRQIYGVVGSITIDTKTGHYVGEASMGEAAAGHPYVILASYEFTDITFGSDIANDAGKMQFVGFLDQEQLEWVVANSQLPHMHFTVNPVIPM